MSERYSCQIRLFGGAGQSKLQKARVAIVGIGGLGTVAASYLARAGIGSLELVDRDVVECGNLNRQLLFDEADINRPKATAAAERLKKMNGAIKIKPTICDFPCKIDSPHVILDCSDNLETRFVINEYAVQKKVPLIYGAASGWTGAISTIIPGVTACLKCIFPGKGGPQGCDTSGVSGPLLGIMGSIQASEAIKYFLGEKLRVLKKGPSAIPNLTKTLLRAYRLRGHGAPRSGAWGLGGPERVNQSSQLILGKILYFDMLHNSFEEVRTKRLTNCHVCGGKK